MFQNGEVGVMANQHLSLREAIHEANRCMNCKKPTCQEGCPISNDIPEFIQSLGRGDIGEAKKIIARKSNLPAVCGRVCAHELQCEGHCILRKNGESIRIGELERCIADFAFDMELPIDKVRQKTQGKVAVIGSGPAGLTVAGDLAKLGFDVTVFEALAEAGGILLYGIPSFRLPKKVVRREVQNIETLGVRFIFNCVVGKDITVDEMFNQGFDAVFIGSGTTIAKELDLPGKELGGIIQSSYLLRMYYLFQSGQLPREEVMLDEGDDVLIIGSGNVAMDAARTAARLGAETVKIIARRGKDKMAAHEMEYEAAIKDGVQFLWNTVSVAYEAEGDHISSLLVEMEGEKQSLDADKIFLAVGSRPANRSVEGLDVDKDGYLIIRDRPYGMTTRRGVFAGGDVVHRPASVVLAMREAKKVALGIAEYVKAVKLLEL
jgi:glutamate synthase (NADPH/NADH) small chain